MPQHLTSLPLTSHAWQCRCACSSGLPWRQPKRQHRPGTSCWMSRLQTEPSCRPCRPRSLARRLLWLLLLMQSSGWMLQRPAAAAPLPMPAPASCRSALLHATSHHAVLGGRHLCCGQPVECGWSSCHHGCCEGHLRAGMIAVCPHKQC